jgi:hypothetical protein
MYDNANQGMDDIFPFQKQIVIFQKISLSI